MNDLKIVQALNGVQYYVIDEDEKILHVAYSIAAAREFIKSRGV